MFTRIFLAILSLAALCQAADQDSWDLSKVPKSELSRAMFESKPERDNAKLDESCIRFGIKVLNIAGHPEYSIYHSNAREVARRVILQLRDHKIMNSRLEKFLENWVEQCIDALTDEAIYEFTTEVFDPVTETPVAAVQEDDATDEVASSLEEENARMKLALKSIRDIINGVEHIIDANVAVSNATQAAKEAEPVIEFEDATPTVNYTNNTAQQEMPVEEEMLANESDEVGVEEEDEADVPGEPEPVEAEPEPVEAELEAVEDEPEQVKEEPEQDHDEDLLSEEEVPAEDAEPESKAEEIPVTYVKSESKPQHQMQELREDTQSSSNDEHSSLTTGQNWKHSKRGTSSSNTKKSRYQKTFNMNV